MLPLTELRGNGLGRAQPIIQLGPIRSGNEPTLVQPPASCTKFTQTPLGLQLPRPTGPLCVWSPRGASSATWTGNPPKMPSTLLERIFWLNEAPNHPCASEDLRCSKPSPSACRPLEASHHGFKCSPHAFIMAIGIRLRLTGRNGPEEMVASRTRALEQNLPCTLCVWHPRDCLPQSSLLLQPRLGNLSNELVRTDVECPRHLGAQIFEVRWTCSCPVPTSWFCRHATGFPQLPTSHSAD